MCEEDASTLWRSLSNPLLSFPFSPTDLTDGGVDGVVKEDFSSEAVGDGEPVSCKAVSGASKTEKLGHKTVFSDSGMEYKPETRTLSSDLYLTH